MVMSVINFLGVSLLWYRIGQDSGMWMVDQQQIIEYYLHRTIDKARRDRES